MSESTAELIIGCDHAAFPLKEIIRKHLEAEGLAVEDAGTHGLESVNYPDYAKRVSEAVSLGQFARGILLCGTGLGMSMVANRFDHVRAALCGDIFTARMSRLHNDSNILVLGGRVIGETLALEIVKTWMETEFEGGRHLARLEKFDKV